MKEIPLNQGKVALVDDEDFEYLSQWKWTYNPNGGGYASRTDRSGEKQRTVLMHKQLIQTENGYQVDHINRNRLDNRKSNLRICTPGQNARNATKRKDGITSKFKGVYFNNRNSKYTAAIQINGKRHHLGYYDEELDAAYYYNQKALEFHKEFAVLNDLPEGYIPKSEFAPENARGRYSKYRGVTYDKRDKRFISQIQYDRGKKLRIGSFHTERIAAEMYNVYAIELHGEKAILNKFDKEEGIIT